MAETKIKLENGYQLFNRLHVRPTLDHLHPKLFPDGGPHHNKIIQITGGPSTGKSTLLLELVIRCILPQKWKDINLNGKNSSAIFINTDHHISLIQIIKAIEKLLGSLEVPIEENESLFEVALKKLTILNCYSSEQFQMTLNSLQHLLSDNFDIALVAIDSLSCYYWYERYTCELEVYSVNNHCVNLLKLLKNVIADLKVVTVFTKYETDKSLCTFVDYTFTLKGKNNYSTSNSSVLTLFNFEDNKQLIKEFCIDTLLIFND